MIDIGSNFTKLTATKWTTMYELTTSLAHLDDNLYSEHAGENDVKVVQYL